MLDTLQGLVAGTIAVVLSLLATFKLLLPKLMDVAIKRLEHSQNQEIKHLEAKLELQSTELVNSLQIASRIGDSYRIKTIESINNLWQDILRVKKEFAPLVAVEALLTETEFESVISSPHDSNEKIRSILNEYSSFQRVAEKITPKDEKVCAGMEIVFGVGTKPTQLDETRIFVSGRLWKIYNGLISTYGRLGFLMSKGMEFGESVSWKRDLHLKGIVGGILPKEIWEQIRRMEFAGFKALIEVLEQEFIIEARKNIKGVDDLAESFSEVKQIVEAEEVKARFRKNYL